MYQWEISLIGRANTLHVFGSCSIQLFPSPLHDIHILCTALCMIFTCRGPPAQHIVRQRRESKGSMLRGIAI